MIKCEKYNESIIQQTILNIIPDNGNEGRVYITPREKEIIMLVSQGKSYQKIADILGISRGRVRNIVSEILGKLELNDRTQLALYATKNLTNDNKS